MMRNMAVLAFFASAAGLYAAEDSRAPLAPLAEGADGLMTPPRKRAKPATAPDIRVEHKVGVQVMAARVALERFFEACAAYRRLVHDEPQAVTTPNIDATGRWVDAILHNGQAFIAYATPLQPDQRIDTAVLEQVRELMAPFEGYINPLGVAALPQGWGADSDDEFDFDFDFGAENIDLTTVFEE